ncbi:AzlD domain-containing protein [Halomarina salina]|uniref:AzlD domain-containing protein n=1 Tax=Halomarina salina TaxID=1872699 RepID=A0ABD5RJ94_9EURY
MRESTVWLVVLAAGLGTFAIRFSFLAVFERTGTVPPRLRRPLRYVPPAVFAALVVPALVFGGEGSGAAAFTPLRLVAGSVAAVVAWRTESVLWTIVSGVLALVALEALVHSGVV